jgi:hypothetical protein
VLYDVAAVTSLACCILTVLLKFSVVVVVVVVVVEADAELLLSINVEFLSNNASELVSSFVEDR